MWSVERKTAGVELDLLVVIGIETGRLMIFVALC